jgi:hypothetical protein
MPLAPHAMCGSARGHKKEGEEKQRAMDRAGNPRKL